MLEVGIDPDNALPSCSPSPELPVLRHSKHIHIEEELDLEDILHDEDADEALVDKIHDEEAGLDWDAEIDDEGLEALTLDDLLWGDVEAELALDSG
ncbi:hypothetical protein VKT23_020087 [Stygiomarasmius scandens]|uniref:Uncharacterized protein n=1 Tax=Marasmiellus scandens TaxID=2682957 RepID=A0ABR1IJT6_9AGAR